MNDPAGVNELENSVLELLENEQAAAADWIAVLEKACQAGAPEAMREWAALAQDALAKRRDLDEGMELLKWRADNTPGADDRQGLGEGRRTGGGFAPSPGGAGSGGGIWPAPGRA